MELVLILKLLDILLLVGSRAPAFIARIEAIRNGMAAAHEAGQPIEDIDWREVDFAVRSKLAALEKAASGEVA